MKIVFIGAGNVATHLSVAMKNAGFEILQIYSRTQNSAKELGELLNVPFCYNLADIDKDGDVYIYSVKDSVLEEIISQINVRNAMHVHTAGSISINVFEKYVKNYGVIYPLQTFSKKKEINIAEIPFFIEANNAKTEENIKNIIQKLSAKSYYLDSEKRILMHLSAVFACNFSNFMYVLAAQITTEANIDFKMLLPLIKETADKLNYLSPMEAQTGPAVRKDEKTIQKHAKILENKTDLLQIYSTLSKFIESTHTNR